MNKNYLNTFERVQKIMANRNMCSRRQAEEWINKGIVFVNGKKHTNLALKVDAAASRIELKKNILIEKKVYIAFNKARGILTHQSNVKGKTIKDFLPKHLQHLVPIGRLDKESEGLILLSNDRVFCKHCLNPKKPFIKVYDVGLSQSLVSQHLDQLEKGVKLFGSRLDPMLVKKNALKNSYLFTLTQGKNRQIRRIMSKFRREVLWLKRVRYGSVDLKGLSESHYTELTQAQLDGFKYNI